MKDFKLFSKVPELYKNMLKDINNAKKFILLETYIYKNDEIGEKFKKALIKKAKQGVRINVLIDGWGSYVDKDYFKELIKLGADIRFFREIRYFIRFISKNHERNHRKLLIIDNDICYIGSANITADCLKWRELTIRITGKIVQYFISAFMETWEIYGKLTKKKIKSFLYRQYEILQDFPSKNHRIIEKKLKFLFRSAKKYIFIETPYFVPSPGITKALINAVKRGVDVKIILPYDSDVKIVDLFRNRYLGKFYEKGIKIFYYMPTTLHTKLLIVDDRFFMFGSSNLDYRSLLHQFEINIFGRNKKLILELKKYFSETLKDSKPFDYNTWKKRSSFKRILEMIISYFENYL
ncbi:MAG: phospholipase D-like domain-containing protein [Candidatus Pacearchaeota archaeon]